jgi:uncharacterized membrane protein YccC
MSGRGNFLARVVQYVVNELIVDRLANNPSFQRFAVRSSKAIEEMAQKGAQTKEELTQQLKVYSESFKEEVGGFISLVAFGFGFCHCVNILSMW